MKITVIHNHTLSQRDHWWYLVQADDGALYVEWKNDNDPNDQAERVSINDFLKTGNSTARGKHQSLTDQMFADA